MMECVLMWLLASLGIVPSLWGIPAKLRVTQFAAIGKDDLLQPAGRVTVLGDVHPNCDDIAGLE